MEHFICNISCNDTQNERTAIQLSFISVKVVGDGLQQRRLLGLLGVKWVNGHDPSFEPPWMIYTQFNSYCDYKIPRIWKNLQLFHWRLLLNYYIKESEIILPL